MKVEENTKVQQRWQHRAKDSFQNLVRVDIVQSSKLEIPICHPAASQRASPCSVHLLRLFLVLSSGSVGFCHILVLGSLHALAIRVPFSNASSYACSHDQSDFMRSTCLPTDHDHGAGILSLFFARVEPPFMQEMHRSACAVLERVSCMKCQTTNSTQTQNTTKQRPTRERKQETLEYRCKVKQV